MVAQALALVAIFKDALEIRSKNVNFKCCHSFDSG